MLLLLNLFSLPEFPIRNVPLSSQLAIGKIHDRATNVELRGSDCYAIGKHALATNYYALAIEWLEVAFQKLKVESNHMMQMAETELENAIMVVSSS